MNVSFKLYASLSDYLPADARNTNTLELDLPDGTTVGEVISARQLPLRMCHLVLVNGVFVPHSSRLQHVLQAGDVLAIWPPVAGG